MRVLYLITFLAFLFSCNPLKHYQKVATDTEVTPKKKAIIAPWVSTNFPVETVYIKGKDSVVVDTAYNQEVVDSLKESLDFLLASLGSDSINIDSIKKVILKNCKPTVVTKTVHRVDTIQKKDEAAVFVIKKQLDESVAREVVKDEEIKQLTEEVKEQRADRNAALLFLSFAILIILILSYFLLKKTLIRLPT